MQTATRTEMLGKAIWRFRIQENPSAAGALPRTLLGELTALPQTPLLVKRDWLQAVPSPRTPSPALGLSGLASSTPHSKISSDALEPTSPEMHKNHSIGGDSANTEYSAINKITGCDGSVIAFAKRKSKLIAVSKVSQRVSENNILIEEQDPRQAATENVRLPTIRWVCRYKQFCGCASANGPVLSPHISEINALTNAGN